MALIGDDCYFYYTSGCVRGSQCAFRHQPAAKSTEVTCPDWLKGVCFKPTCLLRHMLLSNTRNQVHCKWEAMPSGCLDPGCTYIHVNKKGVTPGTTAVDIKSSSASTVKQPLLSSTLPLATLKFSNDIPALQTNNAILPPTNPLRQIIPAIVVTQANIVEPLPSQVLTPSTVLNVAPQLIPMQQPLIINVPRPHLHASILGPPPILPPTSVFPKNDFQQQVQMFKDFLAQKNKAVEDKSFENNGKREKYKEKYTRHKKERRHSRKSSKESKRKLKLSKADEEILYGDYKDIPLEKNEKIEQNDEAMHKINVKSYEEILREKVLRKTMEKRRDKFEEDFNELTSEEKSKKNNELQENTQKVKKSKKITVSGTNIKDRKSEALSKGDSVELSVDGSATLEDLSNSSPRPDKKEIKKTATENSHDESIEIFIPDETADINISIDENDELVKELNEVAQQKKNYLTQSSITNVIHKSSGHKVKKNIKITSPVKNVSLDKANLRIPETAGNKRKVVKIDLHKEKSQVKFSNNKEEAVPVKSDVRVKSFEEIMQEKRKRKVMPNETTSRVSSVKKLSMDPLHAKSAKAKTELRRSVVVMNNINSESKKETKDVIKARSTLGLSSVSSEKLKSEQTKNASLSEVKAVLPRKIITIAKPVVNNESNEKNSIGIRSFDDIMREKQLRKQQEKNISNNNPDKKHPFIKRLTPLVKEKAEFTKPSISSSEPKISRETILEKKAVSDGLVLNNSLTVNQENTVSLKPSEKITNGVGLHKHLNLSDTQKESSNVKTKPYLPSLTEHIKETLEEANLKHDDYLLSDEEFEKEINDLSSDEGDSCINDDIDDDDLITELAEMIDGK